MKLTVALLLALAALPLNADVQTLSFFCISNPSQCGSAAGGLFVDVVGNVASYDMDGPGGLTPIAIGGNQTLFVLRNTNPGSESAHEIYFDDGTLLGISTLFETSGVNYTQFGVSPGDLPGGNNLNPKFNTTAGFSADIDGDQDLGVNDPAERLGILFNLKAGQTYASVLNSLALGGASGGLRIGLHVGGIGPSGSQSAGFVNVAQTAPPPTPIPEPSSTILLGTVVAACCYVFRRRQLA